MFNQLTKLKCDEAILETQIHLIPKLLLPSHFMLPWVIKRYQEEGDCGKFHASEFYTPG